jgi:hypothetical protein
MPKTTRGSAANLFENTDWSGEKRFDAFTFTGLPLFESADEGNWLPVAGVNPEAYYRITINWAAIWVKIHDAK